jgi:hypothetical protein
MEIVTKTFARIKDSERESFLSSFLNGVRALNKTPEAVSGDSSPDLDLDSVFERAIECDLAEGRLRENEASTLFEEFSKLDPDEWSSWIQATSGCSETDVKLCTLFFAIHHLEHS